MSQEIVILLIGLGVLTIWLFFDYRFYKWLGTSPIFGAMKQEKVSYKVGVFSFGVSFYFILFAVLIFIYYKIGNKLNIDFSNFKFVVGLISGAAILNLIFRVAVSFAIRKQDDGGSLLLNGAIFAGIIIIAVVGFLITCF